MAELSSSEFETPWNEVLHLDREPARRVEAPDGEVLARLLGEPWNLEQFLRVAI
jgi:hypothetical protein